MASRKTAKPSRLISLRLPPELEAAVREEAQNRGEPWQSVLKDLLREALGLDGSSATEVKRIPATALQAAARRLKERS